MVSSEVYNLLHLLYNTMALYWIFLFLVYKELVRWQDPLKCQMIFSHTKTYHLKLLIPSDYFADMLIKSTSFSGKLILIYLYYKITNRFFLIDFLQKRHEILFKDISLNIPIPIMKILLGTITKNVGLEMQE